MTTIPHPIPYQGSKRALAPLIGGHVPTDVDVWYEPFAGSAAMSLWMAAKRPPRKIILADSLESMAELWRSIIADPDDGRLRADLTDELGDLLFQVLFHARVAADHAGAPFAVDDVAAALVDKLVRRNPHVFGDARAETLEEIEAQWQAIKLQEKAVRAQGH